MNAVVSIDLIEASDLVRVNSEEFRKLAMVAKVGRAHLGGDKHKDYIYLIDDLGWCDPSVPLDVQR